MKEKLKKYKHKTLGLEADLVKRNSQIVALEDAVVVLKQQLSVGDAPWLSESAGGSALAANDHDAIHAIKACGGGHSMLFRDGGGGGLWIWQLLHGLKCTLLHQPTVAMTKASR